jgi:hypothetical protein
VTTDPGDGVVYLIDEAGDMQTAVRLRDLWKTIPDPPPPPAGDTPTDDDVPGRS